MKVVVLGASDKPDRYSHMALKKLVEKGHVPVPVHPRLKSIEGHAVYPSLAAIREPVDAVTVYLSAARSDGLAADLLASEARIVVFNPGAENPALAERLRGAGKQVVEACTLVLLSQGAVFV